MSIRGTNGFMYIVNDFMRFRTADRPLRTRYNTTICKHTVATGGSSHCEIQQKRGKLLAAVEATTRKKGKGRKGKGRKGTQSHKTLYFGYLWGGHP